MRRINTLVTTVILVSALAAGCSQSRSDEVDPESSSAFGTQSEVTVQLDSTTQSGSAPTEALDITGPWATDFADAYRRATSDFGRQVLAKGHITDAELAETESLMATCLESKGYTEIVFHSDGTSGMADELNRDGDVVSQDRMACSYETSYIDISGLYYNMRLNPENLDWSVITVDCLKEQELVEKSFTVDDYNQLFASQEFDFATYPDWVGCMRDPLGKLGNQ